MNRLRNILRQTLMTIICLLLSQAAAQAAVNQRALSVSQSNPTVEIAAHAEYLLDSTNALRYDDVAYGQLPFQPHTKNSFQFSFKKATLWIKCHIAAAEPEESAVIKSNRLSFLVFDNAALGSVTLYVPVIKDGAPVTLELRGGWQQGKTSSEIAFLYPTFVLPANIDASRPVTIRVSTPYALQFRATLYTVDAFRENSFTLFAIVGFFAGILIAMILYNIVLYLFIRDKHYIYYILYIFFLLFWQCVLIGLFRYFHPPLGELFLSYITMFSAFMMMFAIIFALVYLKASQTIPRHDLILKGIALLMGIIVVMVILRQLWISNVLAYLAGQAATVLLFTSAVSALRSGFKPALYYLVAVSTLLTAAIIFIFRFYGWLPNNTFTMHVMLFGSAAESILLSFALAYRIRVLREEERALRENEKVLQAISVTDELTGMFNRRFLNASLVKKVAAARRGNANLSVLMMDVDHFKQYNDAYGHPEGDKVLENLGKLLAETLREEDIACRYGGEEFVVILDNADIKSALEAAERIRSGLEIIAFQPDAKKEIHTTVSIGAAQLLPEESPEQLIARADQALYQAKQTGRNRICRA